MARKKTITRTKTSYYRVDRREIAFLKFIFEAYNGVATLTTIDPTKGIVALRSAPHCREQVAEILQNLKKEIIIQPVASVTAEQKRKALF
jgi:hypothetical protein